MILDFEITYVRSRTFAISEIKDDNFERTAFGIFSIFEHHFSANYFDGLFEKIFQNFVFSYFLRLIVR